MNSRERFDLLVLGGGMAGMSAAAEAASQGARVIVCEISDRLGGTALMSTGNIWTVATAEAFRESDPEGSVELWQVVRDNLEASLEWLADLGVSVTERHRASLSSTYNPPPVGRNVDIEGFVTRSQRLVEKAGGWVLRGVSATRLITNGAKVTGAEIRSEADDEVLEVDCKGVVLATGGFQNSSELRALYLGQTIPESVPIRSNPHSDGVGFRLGLQAGAAASDRMDTFYGVLLPAVSDSISERDFRSLVLHSASYGVVLAPDGTRPTDESAGTVQLAEGVARVGRAVLIFGQEAVREIADRLGTNPLVVMRQGASRGARFVDKASRDEICSALDEWGYDGSRARVTLEEFDRRLLANEDLIPERRHNRIPLEIDGLAMLEVQAAITSTLGGIRTDSFGQAIGKAGDPIPGLFAAGVDQGGYNVAGYAGGLARSLVFGRRAAQRALEANGQVGA